MSPLPCLWASSLTNTYGKLRRGKQWWREGATPFLLSTAFPCPSSPFPFPLVFPSSKGGWSVPVTLKFLILCYIYTEKIIKSADRIRGQTKFFCIDTILGVILNVMDVTWEQSMSRMSKRQTLHEYLWKNLCALKMSCIIRTVCLFSVTSTFT